MKNNYVAKHAHQNRAKFHTEKAKPNQNDEGLVFKCHDCQKYSLLYESDLRECEFCLSDRLTLEI